MGFSAWCKGDGWGVITWGLYPDNMHDPAGPSTTMYLLVYFSSWWNWKYEIIMESLISPKYKKKNIFCAKTFLSSKSLKMSNVSAFI